ncbi:MAG: glycosyltransferase [Opitutales bacterium]|nr:glycosyltransferase [Opitutales bacterium]
MRICLVTPDIVGPIQNGGIGTFCTHILELLKGHHELTLVFTAEKERNAASGWQRRYEQAGIRIVTLNELQAHAESRDINPVQDRFLQRSWMVYQWLTCETFDLVHFQDWGANGFYAIRAQRTGLALSSTRLAVTVHSPSEWLRQGMREWPGDTLAHLRLHYAERYCVEHAHTVVFPSAHMRDWCREEGWSVPENNSVIPCPYTMDSTAPTGHGKEPDPAHLVFFGRLEARKGLDIFLKALERILSGPSHGIKRISFVGKDGCVNGEAGSQRIRKLQKRVPGVELRTLTTLDMPGALTYLRESRGIVWMPSRIDNCPYTVIECIENRIPFYVAATGGTPELVHASRTFPLSLGGIIDKILACGEAADTEPHPYSAESANTLWLKWHSRRASRPTSAAKTSRGKPPLVTVCVPYFNQPEFLPHTLKALKRIEYPDLEVIVINDGSTEPEAAAVWNKMAQQYEEAGWTFHELEVNQGLGAARNAAARISTGKFLVFNDSDNCAFPRMIERFVHAMAHSGADCLTCGFVRHHCKSDPFQTPRPGKVIRPLGPFTLLGLLDNVYGDANFCIRRDVFDAVGGFCEDHETATHDWEFLLRLDLGGYDIDVIPTELFWYRHLPQSMMRQADLYQSHLVAVQSWLSQHDSSRDRRLFTQLTLPLFHEQQQLRKSWSRLPRFLQRWFRRRRHGHKKPCWRFWT